MFIPFGSRILFIYCLLDARRTIFGRVSAGELAANVADDSSNDADHAGRVQPKWISELFIEARSIFRIDDRRVSLRCKKDAEIYALHLKNQTVGAVRMMESSEWPATGLFAGMTKPLGNWEECIRAEVSHFKGRYCLARMFFDYDSTNDGLDPTAISSASEMNKMSVWRAIKMFERDTIRSSRLKLMWALCVPSSCTAEEVEMSLNATLLPIFAKHDFHARIHVEPDYCSGGDKSSAKSSYFYISSYFFAAIIGIVSVVTIFDILVRNFYNNVADKKSRNLGTLSGFSVLTSWKSLNDDTLPADWRIISFVKVIAMCAVIMGHTAVFEFRLSVFQTEKIEEMFHPHHRILNDSVDLFLILGGFMLYSSHYARAKVEGVRYVIHTVVRKWIRLALIYGVYILFWVNIMPYLGDGPFWKAEISKEVRVCVSYWWLNLLGLANIPTFQPTCILTSWFVSVYIQLTILGGVVLAVVSKNMLIGIWFLFGTILSSVVFTFFMVYWHEYNVMILGFLKVIEDHRSMKDGYFYISTYPRAGPYLLGFATAMLVDHLQNQKYKFSPIQKVFFLATTIDIAVRFALYKATFYAFARPYNVLESAAFAAIQRSVTVLPIACLLCINFTSGFDSVWYRNVFACKAWTPIGRLVPTVSFVHFFLLVFNTYSRRTYSPVHNLFGVFWHGIAYIIYSYGFALLAYLLVEKPMENILNAIEEKLDRMYRNTRPTNTAIRRKYADHRCVQ